MSWAVGEFQGRDIGYGVPAICDHPDCNDKIDRGLGYVCAWEEVWGGEDGCGLFFCLIHGGGSQCERCEAGRPPFDPKPDTAEWITHKLTHRSWQQWRDENPGIVDELRKALIS